ncbi:MAG: hypothetical protein ACRD1Y_00365 [Terriglobales bacterium]
MTDPAHGPYLFETSAESWLARTPETGAATWVREYLERFEIHVSAITNAERVRGYALLWHKAAPEQRARIEAARVEYLCRSARVLPFDSAAATYRRRVDGRRSEPAHTPEAKPPRLGIPNGPGGALAL